MDPNVKAAEKENQALGWAVSPNPWVNLASGMAIVTLALMLISYNEARSVAGIQALSNGVFRAMSLPDNVMFPAYE
ncbi:MAG: hypothetical protein OEZ04_11965, partial [Nitrospinota bacterium]|nr:hypothetical protein [Nitrospinota bacterium]